MIEDSDYSAVKVLSLHQVKSPDHLSIWMRRGVISGLRSE